MTGIDEVAAANDLDAVIVFAAGDFTRDFEGDGLTDWDLVMLGDTEGQEFAPKANFPVQEPSTGP
jgi:hypothetical protein